MEGKLRDILKVQKKVVWMDELTHFAQWEGINNRHVDFGCGRKITILECESNELVLPSQLWLEKQNLLNKM